MSELSFFYLPSEWSPQAAVWLSWPSNPQLWPGCFDKIPAFFAEFAAAISQFEPVCINAAARQHEAIAQLIAGAGGQSEHVRLYDHPTNDVWCRDHGPLFLKDEKTGSVVVSDWRFNAWGGKFSPFDQDDAVPSRVATALGMARIAHNIILEGGAVEINDDRQLMTTRSVILNPNRAWTGSEQAAAGVLCAGLGAREVFWLDDGLVGDDTDGHIDNIARFAPGGKIVAACATAASPHAQVLEANRQQIAQWRRVDGSRFEVVDLPLPDRAVYAPDGQALPASYANYLVLNNAVLYPAYAQPSDSRAAAILRDVFPERQVLGIDCRAVLVEGGALHCLSQQQPA